MLLLKRYLQTQQLTILFLPGTCWKFFSLQFYYFLCLSTYCIPLTRLQFALLAPLCPACIALYYLSIYCFTLLCFLSPFPFFSAVPKVLKFFHFLYQIIKILNLIIFAKNSIIQDEYQTILQLPNINFPTRIQF